MPKPPKKGYIINPTMADMMRMSADELTKVKNLVISNAHGSIYFEGYTDVTRVNFGDIVQIEH